MSSRIKNLILVASGKGGVGKSTVSANLALALVKRGHATGLLDADVHGPSIPTMFGADDRATTNDERTIEPVIRFGLKLMSMGYLVDPDQAMIWRGPMTAGAASQLVSDVAWGELDYLIVDLPPGTGDIQLTLAQKFKITGAVLVTTPQTVALADVRRAKTMFDKVDVPCLGVVENMSYFICSNCSARHEIFAHGGGERIAQTMSLPFLGRIPLESRVRECGDEGMPMVQADPNSETTRAFITLAEALEHRAAEVAERAAAQPAPEGHRRSLPIVAS